MDEPKRKRTSENTEAWIIGSGTASLASALYLIKHFRIQPSRVHILDAHASLEEASHHEGNASGGYDQFAGCLPVPGGLPMRELLAMVPSAELQGQSILEEIQMSQARRDPANENNHTSFLAKKNGTMKDISTRSLNLTIRHRMSLAHFLLKREKSLSKRQIHDFFPDSFFESAFWTVFSVQFGFQPWHSAAEFRRGVRQYLPEFHSLSIINGLDITGYYQYEYLYLPIYSHLQDCGVDFRFDTKVKNIEVTNNGTRNVITGLRLIHNEVESHTSLEESDIVIANLGSTVSGSAVGANDIPPVWQSYNADDMLDQNWSIWLDLGNKHCDLGDPYSFCTRQSESMLESFTITTGNLEFFNSLRALSRCIPEAGVFIFLEDSGWNINLCIPSQPVFPRQPQNVRVLWGMAHSPECEGNFVKKPMLQCPGTDIMAELLGHLGLDYQAPMARTITIPRAMPRMRAMLLTRAPSDRPQIIPQAFSNVGLVGHFVESPRHTCIDVSYGIRTAQIAVAGLMGKPTPMEASASTVSIIRKVMCWV